MSKTARRLFKGHPHSRSAAAAISGLGSGSGSAPPSDIESDGYNSDGSVLSIDEIVTPPEHMVDYHAELSSSLDLLLEKRASVRESGLIQLTRLLGHKYLAEELDPILDTTLDALLRCAKRDKNPAENIAAAKGPGHESRFSELVDTSLPLVMKSTAGRTELVRAALVNTLSLACFVTGSLDQTHNLTRAYMELAEITFRNLLSANEANSGSAAVQAAKAAASATSGQAKVNVHSSQQGTDKLPGSKLLPELIASLGVLASTVSTSVIKAMAPAMAALMVRIVDPSSPLAGETKVLAAENMAILVEVEALPTVTEHKVEKDKKAESNRTMDNKTTEQPEMNVVAELNVHLQSVMGPAPGDMSVKRGAQRDRKTIRAAYRDVLAYLQEEHRPTPTLRLKFRKEQVILQTWCQLRQLYIVRSCLGTMVQVHFLHNPMLRDIFQYSLSSDASMSKAERKARFNPSSEIARSKTQYRTKQRSIRATKINQQYE